MRKALIVGIDHYAKINPLSGCVNDAHAVKSVLERHANGSVNFATPLMLVGSNAASAVTKKALKEAGGSSLRTTQISRCCSSLATAILRTLAAFYVQVTAKAAMTASR